MANEVVKINGVTKVENNGDYIYLFPLTTITAQTTQASYIQTDNQSKTTITIQFTDITDKLGATDIQSYCDELATQGFFFDLNLQEQQTQTEILNELIKTNNNIERINNNLVEMSQNILFFIKAIAE